MYLFCTRRPFASAYGRHQDQHTASGSVLVHTLTSVSSTGDAGGGGSFLGFLPGLGLAGMTHSLEAGGKKRG